MVFKQAHLSNYKKGRSSAIRYIVLHYTANRGDTAQNNLDYFARTETKASAHYFVDKNGWAQSVKDTDTAYHVGAKQYAHKLCRNSNSIGVEMCDSVNGVPAATQANAVKLVRELMQKYNVPVENVLRHYDVTGKKCPAPWVDKPTEWLVFKELLKEGGKVTKQEAKTILKEKAGLSDASIVYLDSYRYGDDLILKLAKAMK